jgi:predicted alpha/beta-hydrolase family hydrolase
MAGLTTPHGRVSYAVDGDAAPCTVVLAPGAGAGMGHEFMELFSEGLAAQGLQVVRFNFVYAEQGRKSPDRQPVLEDTYRAVVDYVRTEFQPSKLVVGGKSMGGRIASHIAAAGTDVDGLVFLGYPLHPPGRPDRLRDAHLYEITAPMLFVEGTRDPFCPLETLERVRAKIAARNDLCIVEDGDHSLKVRKSSGGSTRAAWDAAVQAVSEWTRTL